MVVKTQSPGLETVFGNIKKLNQSNGAFTLLREAFAQIDQAIERLPDTCGCQELTEQLQHLQELGQHHYRRCLQLNEAALNLYLGYYEPASLRDIEDDYHRLFYDVLELTRQIGNLVLEADRVRRQMPP